MRDEEIGRRIDASKALIHDYMKGAREAGMSEGGISMTAAAMMIVALIDVTPMPKGLAEIFTTALDLYTKAELAYVVAHEEDLDREKFIKALNRAIRAYEEEDDDELPLWG